MGDRLVGRQCRRRIAWRILPATGAALVVSHDPDLRPVSGALQPAVVLVVRRVTKVGSRGSSPCPTPSPRSRGARQSLASSLAHVMSRGARHCPSRAHVRADGRRGHQRSASQLSGLIAVIWSGARTRPAHRPVCRWCLYHGRHVGSPCVNLACANPARHAGSNVDGYLHRDSSHKTRPRSSSAQVAQERFRQQQCCFDG